MTRPAPSSAARSRFFLAALLALGSPAVARAQQPPPALKPGDDGDEVEKLQRSLNAQPGATRIDVDGDFGEGTKNAVIRFQRSRGLPPTGVADAATRKALGPPPPPEAEPTLPPPEVVNAEVIPRKPAEPLDGPPAVLAPTWAICDGKTGELLWGGAADKPVEMASTTKMMTALIVARFAEKDSKVLDEIVTFSERADRTPGSTSGIKAGEKLPVGELLYGLMLPSGNDAATAFAEHFGARCAPPESAPDEANPVPRFVAEMNRVAAELGMKETHFGNPHGLPVADHHASARDLAKLASVGLRNPIFARVVNTPKHGYAPTSADGKTRNVVWTNTNRLLGTEGYDGVKTGTTTAAGNCLVASGHRGDGHLIVVILGAPTTDARYADARNLFRYGWTRLAAARGSAAQ
ncbi:peptidoglycan-binding protein [Tundrisphaera sp. TA3]|uniref:peptidoglycan-binding protein n=1 Tax=Tundrisphaera sp. TA3 TaxID=3435775 RepID=UPI003EB77144